MTSHAGLARLQRPDRIGLEPYQTVAIDIQKLKDSKKRDVRGHVFPERAMRGQVVWYEELPRSIIGRAEQVNAVAGIARSFSCSNPCPCPPNFKNGFLSPSSVTGPVGDQGSMFTPFINEVDCNGVVDGPFAWGANNWTSSNTTVATVTSSGTESCLSPGTTTITAFMTVPKNLTSGDQCLLHNGTGTGSGPMTVQKPMSLQVLSASILPTGTTGAYGCTPTSDFGIKLDVMYQVLDQNNQPIKDATMVPHEHVVYTTGQTVDQDICPSRISTCTHTTDANGIWHDAPYGACAPFKFSVGLTQKITIILNGVPYDVRTNNVSVSSTSAGHGSISNGLDINKTR